MTDHGPQRQPASDEWQWKAPQLTMQHTAIIEAQTRELASMRAALKAVLEWYDRDGSVGGCDVLIEDVVRPLLAADALRGEGGKDG